MRGTFTKLRVRVKRGRWLTKSWTTVPMSSPGGEPDGRDLSVCLCERGTSFVLRTQSPCFWRSQNWEMLSSGVKPRHALLSFLLPALSPLLLPPGQHALHHRIQSKGPRARTLATALAYHSCSLVGSGGSNHAADSSQCNLLLKTVDSFSDQPPAPHFYLNTQQASQV